MGVVDDRRHQLTRPMEKNFASDSQPPVPARIVASPERTMGWVDVDVGSSEKISLEDLYPFPTLGGVQDIELARCRNLQTLLRRHVGLEHWIIWLVGGFARRATAR
jgi:hypothetical protein